VIILLLNKYYVLIFNVEDDVRHITRLILVAYAIVMPAKVQNMIFGGILRSGGRTTYVMTIDMIGTWIFGVPLGLLAAFVLRLPIELVYVILSLEEYIRVIISIVIFKKKKWMQKL
jgi:Na+-driven multidrug efflux pump